MSCIADGSPDQFTFIVFGDFNGGGCYRLNRVQRTIDMMAGEQAIDFFVNTGDLIDGDVQSDGSATCFGSDPAVAAGAAACGATGPNGNIAEMLSAISAGAADDDQD